MNNKWRKLISLVLAFAVTMTGIVNNTVAVKADNMSEMVTITFTTGNGNNESGYLSVSGSGEYTYEVPDTSGIISTSSFKNLMFLNTNTSSQLKITVKSIVINGTAFNTNQALDITSDTANGMPNIWSIDKGVIYSNGTKDIYHTSSINNGDIVYREDGVVKKITSVKYVFTIEAPAKTLPLSEEEGYKAFLMFTDSEWKWSNMSLNTANGGTGAGTDATITGNGTYTVSIDKTAFPNESAAKGISVFCVDMVGMAKAKNFNAANVVVKDVIIKCDGKKIASDASHMFVGDIEANGNLRIELCNMYGYRYGAFQTINSPGFDATNFTFSESLSVTFTLEGITEGSTPVYSFVDENNTVLIHTASGITEADDAATETVIPDSQKISGCKARMKYRKKGVRYERYVELTWKQGKDVAGFEVYRSDGTSTKPVRIATVTNGDTGVFKDENIEPNTRYRYIVWPMVLTPGLELQRAQMNESEKNGYITSIKVGKTLKKPSVSLKTSRNNLILTFKGAEGRKYQTQYRWAGKKKWKMQTKLQGAVQRKIVRSTRSKGYYLRVRTYSVVNGKKYYSPWSSAMLVK